MDTYANGTTPSMPPLLIAATRKMSSLYKSVDSVYKNDYSVLCYSQNVLFLLWVVLALQTMMEMMMATTASARKTATTTPVTM